LQKFQTSINSLFVPFQKHLSQHT